MLALQLDVRNRWVCIIGAGSVGQRKAEILQRAGARIKWIDPKLPEASGPTDQLLAIRAEYQEVHLDGCFFAVVAVPIPHNRQPTADARRRGLLVCDTAEPENGNVIFPAVHQVGPLSIAVSTASCSPRLAARIRDRLAEEYPAEYGAWVAYLGELRDEILAGTTDSPLRQRMLETVQEDRWWQLWKQHGPIAVDQAVREFLTCLRLKHQSTGGVA